jgi:hypothetical protein
MDDIRNHTLLTPIRRSEAEGGDITTLTFHEPDVGEMITAAKAGGGDAVIERMAQLALSCGLDLPTFKRIKSRDLTAIMALTGDWLGNGEAPAGN